MYLIILRWFLTLILNAWILIWLLTFIQINYDIWEGIETKWIIYCYILWIVKKFCQWPTNFKYTNKRQTKTSNRNYKQIQTKKNLINISILLLGIPNSVWLSIPGLEVGSIEIFCLNILIQSHKDILGSYFLRHGEISQLMSRFSDSDIRKYILYLMPVHN